MDVGDWPYLRFGPRGPVKTRADLRFLQIWVDREGVAHRFDLFGDLCLDLCVAFGAVGGKAIDDLHDPACDLAELFFGDSP